MIAMSVKDFPLPWNKLNMFDDPRVDGHFANLSSPIPGQKKDTSSPPSTTRLLSLFFQAMLTQTVAISPH